MAPTGLAVYARICGWTLARAPAALIGGRLRPARAGRRRRPPSPGARRRSLGCALNRSRLTTGGVSAPGHAPAHQYRRRGLRRRGLVRVGQRTTSRTSPSRPRGTSQGPRHGHEQHDAAVPRSARSWVRPRRPTGAGRPRGTLAPAPRPGWPAPLSALPSDRPGERADPAPHRGRRPVELGGDPPVPGPPAADQQRRPDAVVSARRSVAAAGRSTWVTRRMRPRAHVGPAPTSGGRGRAGCGCGHDRTGAAGGCSPGRRVCRRPGRPERGRPERVGDPDHRGTVRTRRASMVCQRRRREGSAGVAPIRPVGRTSRPGRHRSGSAR
jgi:hypothetical protein